MQTLTLIVGLVLSIASGLAITWEQRLLEYTDVRDCRLILSAKRNVPISITGRCADTYSVSAIERPTEGGTVTLLVYTHVARQGDVPTFYIPLHVTDAVDTIRFGASGLVIWKREARPTVL